MSGAARAPAARNPWVRISPSRPGERLRLVCFPYAGGTAATYHSWQTHLPESISLCAVQLPGRADRIREMPIKQLGSMLACLETALAPVFRAGPFAFFGHSMGALIAFELTRRLRQRGGPEPVVLFVSGRAAPDIADIAATPLHALSNAELVDWLRALNGTPEEVLANPEAMELVIGSLRADVEMLETWRHVVEPPLHVPIVALAGQQDTSVTVSDVNAWSRQTTAAFTLEYLHGDHFFVESDVGRVVKIVRDSLALCFRSPAPRADARLLEG